MRNEYVHTANPRVIANLPQGDSGENEVFPTVTFKIFSGDKGRSVSGLGYVCFHRVVSRSI